MAMPKLTAGKDDQQEKIKTYALYGGGLAAVGGLLYYFFFRKRRR